MERSHPPIDDKELWDDFVLKGREESFHVLVQRHKLGLFNAAYRILYDTHAAEDVVQRVFVALIERKNELANVGSLQCWLYRATFNQALNMKKLRRKRKNRERAGETPSTPETPRETAVRGELRQELDLALAKLKESSRIPIILRYLQGMSQAETSETLGLSSEATRKRISRALKRLRKLLTGRGLLISLLAVEEGLRAVPARAASANFLSSTSSILSAASTGAAGEAAISSTSVITGVTIMTAKVKIAIGIIAVMALALLLTFTLRSTHRERRVAPPPERASEQVAKRKSERPRTTPPEENEEVQTPSYDELEEVALGSISGQLVDAVGNSVKHFNERGGGIQFFMVAKGAEMSLMGSGIMTRCQIDADGRYEVTDLPANTYSVERSGRFFRIRGLCYYVVSLPKDIPIGTTNADIVVMCGNPGKVRGRVLDARTMLPVRKFAVYQKCDLTSAPDLSRQSTAYSLLKDRLPADAFLKAARREYEKAKERVETLDPALDTDQVRNAFHSFSLWKLLKESCVLDIESEDGVFEQDGYILGRHILTVITEDRLPNSMEVELKDRNLVELTFLMRQGGSAVTGRLEDDSGEPVEGAAVEVLIPTNAMYFYEWMSDPGWETVTSFTSESGAFGFHEIPDATYQVRASHANYGTVAVSSVRVINGRQEPSNLVLKMSAGKGSVWGQIIGADGSPLAGVAVRVSSGSCDANSKTDENGYYMLRGLPAGRYAMTVDKGELTDREYLFSLNPSQELRYDITMWETAALEGNICTGGQGKLAPWLRLVLRSSTLAVRREDHVRLPGGKAHYIFKFLPPGEYKLEALSEILGNIKYKFSLSSGEAKVLDVNLGRYGNLKGRIIGRDGAPVSGVTTKVASPGSESFVQSDGQGRYSVSDLSSGHIELTIMDGKFAGTWYEFELKRDEDKEFDIDFSAARDVKGRILKSDRKPLGLAVLRIESPHRTVEVITDREGRFRAEGLFPGQCRIHLPVPRLGRAYTFELAPKEQKDLKILLPP